MAEVIEGTENTGMDAVVETLDTLYTTVGFNHLLGALDTLLVRKWDTAQRLGVATNDVAQELARLKKAQRMLSEEERAAVRAQGILWYPTP